MVLYHYSAKICWGLEFFPWVIELFSWVSSFFHLEFFSKCLISKPDLMRFLHHVIAIKCQTKLLCLPMCTYNKVTYLNLGLRETRRTYPRYNWVDLSKFPVEPKWWFLKGCEITRVDCCSLLILPVHIFSYFSCKKFVFQLHYYTPFFLYRHTHLEV